ncbi:hypothetical protein MJO29_016137 [Puccinia striiformis f. sp. tritici]|nr:hypothetical protein Pst134EB_030945 [Puccinia striiformis f. sp. tritici]KAI7934874.1 hypothetical protein MJO29_016137 [Puccinia striiformis f. sp. tritici]
MKALEGLSAKASRKKYTFDSKLRSDSLQVYDVGDSVKLRNESHTKGQPRWFGPFQIKTVLDNNVYILVDPSGDDYARPREDKVQKELTKKAKALTKVTPPAVT